MKERTTSSLQLRVLLKNGRELGPDNVTILDAIVVNGSITAAARAMGVSYKHAWKLVHDLNHCFTEPLVGKVIGGRHGGGATLTEAGATVLATYRAIEKKASKIVAAELGILSELTAKRAT